MWILDKFCKQARTKPAKNKSNSQKYDESIPHRLNIKNIHLVHTSPCWAHYLMSITYWCSANHVTILPFNGKCNFQIQSHHQDFSYWDSVSMLSLYPCFDVKTLVCAFLDQTKESSSSSTSFMKLEQRKLTKFFHPFPRGPFKHNFISNFQPSLPNPDWSGDLVSHREKIP